MDNIEIINRAIVAYYSAGTEEEKARYNNIIKDIFRDKYEEIIAVRRKYNRLSPTTLPFRMPFPKVFHLGNFWIDKSVTRPSYNKGCWTFDTLEYGEYSVDTEYFEPEYLKEFERRCSEHAKAALNEKIKYYEDRIEEYKNNLKILDNGND